MLNLLPANGLPLEVRVRFDGKTVVVTGGADGIGKAICQLLAQRGATVAVLDRNDIGGLRLAKEIEQSGTKALFAALDVSDFRAVESVIRHVGEVFGGVDSLIVSAGIQRYGTWRELSFR